MNLNSLETIPMDAVCVRNLKYNNLDGFKIIYILPCGLTD